MAHEFESGFFVRVPAWHRLGVVVNDAPTTEDAIRLAGLDWEVIKAPLYVSDNKPEMGSLPLLHEVQTHKAIVRRTDKRILGVVGSNYKPLQNAQAFRFFDPILEGGHARLEAAGSLRHGRRVWILARLLGADAEVVPGDKVSAYLLLSNWPSRKWYSAGVGTVVTLSA